MAERKQPRSYVLELSKVSRQFGSEPAVHALVDVDLRLERGEWLAITGPSGAGKSTLLNILGCLDRPSSGSDRSAVSGFYPFSRPVDIHPAPHPSGRLLNAGPWGAMLLAIPFQIQRKVH